LHRQQKLHSFFNFHLPTHLILRALMMRETVTTEAPAVLVAKFAATSEVST